jgi:solute carrier family 25 (adenine nucleotide translocator) protein 4/5/6/31
MSGTATAGSSGSKLLASFVVDFFLAGVSSAVSKTLAAPVERSKLLLQMQDDLLRTGRLGHRYTGTFDCIGTILRQEGFAGLFRGTWPNVIRYYPTQLINCLLKDDFKKLFQRDKRQGYMKWFLANLASGSLAGTLSLAVVYPLDYACTRLACDIPDGSGKYQFSGAMDVILQTAATEGISGLYRGFLVSAIGIVVYRGIYFGLYDAIYPIVFTPRNNSFLVKFLFGWGITIAAGLLSYPIDTIRRKMMLHSALEPGYDNSLTTTITIFNMDGIGGFFGGAGANVCRALLGAAILMGYEQLQYLMFGRTS